MKKIYLSGPVSGRPLEEARVQFGLAEEFLLKHFGRENIMVYNPMKFNEYAPEKKWQDYMHTCLAVLETCDAILMLKGWHKSYGSNCEYFYAKGCGIEPWVMCTDVLTDKGEVETKILTHEGYIKAKVDKLFKMSNGFNVSRIFKDECKGHAVVEDEDNPNTEE